MAKYKFEDIVDVNSFNAGIKSIEKSLKDLDSQISKSGVKEAISLQKQLAESTKQLAQAEALRAKTEKELSIVESNRAKTAATIQRTEQQAINFSEKRKNSEKRKQEQIKKGIVTEEQAKEAVNKQIKSYNMLVEVTNLLVRRRAQLDITTKQGIAEFNRLTPIISKNTEKLKEQDAQIGRFQRNVGNYTSAFKGLFSAFGIVGGISLLASGLKSAFNVIEDFDAKIAELGAVSGTSGKKLEDIKNSAKDIAPALGLTASQAAQAGIELAKLGYAGDDIKNSLDGVLKGAIAMGASVPDAAELASKTIKAFGLDISRTSDVMSIFAASSNKTATGFRYIADSMPYAATAAKQYGMSLEQTTALLGILADNGIRGESAGVALRDIFIDLSTKGISFDDAMKKISSSTDKTKTAFDIFGKTSANQAVILSNNIGKFKEYTDAVTNQGTALDDLVKKRLDTAQGALQIFKANWEGLILSVEDGSGTIANVFKTIILFAAELLKSFSRGNAITESIKTNFELFKNYGKAIVELLQALGLFNKESSNAENTINALGKAFELLTYGMRLQIWLLTKLVEFLTYLANKFNEASTSGKAFRAIVLTLVTIMAPVPTLIYAVYKSFSKMNEETEKSTNAMKKFGEAAVEGLGKAAKWAQDVDKYYRQMQKDYEASKNKQAQKDNEVTDIALENLKQRQEKEMRYYIESSKNEEDIAKLKNKHFNEITNFQIRQLQNAKTNAKGEELTAKEVAENHTKIEQLKTQKTEENAKYRADIAVKNWEKQLQLMDDQKTAEMQQYERILNDFQSQQEYNSKLLDEKQNAELIALYNTAHTEQQITDLKEKHATERTEFEIQQAIDLIEFRKNTTKDLTDKEKKNFDILIQSLQIKLLEAKGKAQKKKGFELDNWIASQLGLSNDKETYNAVKQAADQLIDYAAKYVEQAIDQAKARADAEVENSRKIQEEKQNELDNEKKVIEEKKRAGVAYSLAEKERLEKEIREQKRRERDALKESQRLSKIKKAMDIAQAVGNTAIGVTKAFATYAFPYSAIIAALVAAAGAAQVAIISKQKYAKGGSFVLRGKSHDQGGIDIGGGREAEGGEAVSIFSRSATKKHYPHIKRLTDEINKGTYNFEKNQQINVNLSNEKEVQYLQQIAKNTETKVFFNRQGKRVEKKGNITITYN